MTTNMLALIFDLIATGIGATALLDLWTLFATRVLGLPGPNWGNVGRWIGYFPQGRFVHHNIAAAKPIAGERMIGWGVHYLVGIIYAALLLFLSGPDWFGSPTLAPALTVGLATVLAPFLIMQPAMGAGFAAAKTPNPRVARFSSIVAHSVFGLGLYLAALMIA